MTLSESETDGEPRPSLAMDGKIKCGNCENFPGALTIGLVYDVIAEDLFKGQYQIKGCNGRKRWYPAYCFVPMDQPTPRVVSFEIDKHDDEEVNIVLDDGRKRFFSLISIARLTSILQSNPFYKSQASVFVKDLETIDLENIVTSLQNSGEILSATVGYDDYLANDDDD